MPDAILGVIIGGAFGLIPSVLVAVLNYRSRSEDRKHELKVKNLEVYGRNRLDAVTCYLNQFGALFSSFYDAKDFSYDKYFAASERAACFVSDETRSSMKKADGLIFAQSVKRDIPIEDFSALRTEIAVAFANELLQPLEYTSKKPKGRCKK